LNIKAPQDIVVEHLENRALTLTLKALHSGVSIPQLKSRGFCRLVRFSGGCRARSLRSFARRHTFCVSAFRETRNSDRKSGAGWSLSYFATAPARLMSLQVGLISQKGTAEFRGTVLWVEAGLKSLDYRTGGV
jgi:hypothetical protein